jgi:hypothetical protein
MVTSRALSADVLLQNILTDFIGTIVGIGMFFPDESSITRVMEVLHPGKLDTG